MRTSLLIVILPLCIAKQTPAQDYFYIRAGGNYTIFRGEKTYLQAGSSFGIGRQWNYRNRSGWSKGIGWALELVYTNKRALLKNKTVGGGLSYDYIVSYEDIHCSVTSFEIPVLLTFDYPLYKKLKAHFNMGPALSLGIKDRSRSYRQKVKLLEPDQRSNYPFDYVVNPGDPTIADSWGLVFNLGAGISYSSFSFDILLSPALLYEIATITAINFYETPDTFHSFITLRFNIE